MWLRRPRWFIMIPRKVWQEEKVLEVLMPGGREFCLDCLDWVLAGLQGLLLWPRFCHALSSHVPLGRIWGSGSTPVWTRRVWRWPRTATT